MPMWSTKMPALTSRPAAGSAKRARSSGWRETSPHVAISVRGPTALAGAAMKRGSPYFIESRRTSSIASVPAKKAGSRKRLM
ncbi:hypothetical protein [Bradyrhizobium canariense]|uniref:hypothetical protein n=1 Tax=Bradyrhizobium canariense TaxID=255045 RepID=UPI0019591D18|nr:hypothetical protein [Bradyrhizobium canariense]MBM7486099.1 hypothetical protein [Bradyrhizobium canariense]